LTQPKFQVLNEVWYVLNLKENSSIMGATHYV